MQQVFARFPELCPRFPKFGFHMHYKGLRYLFVRSEDGYLLAGHWPEVPNSILTDRKDELAVRGEFPSKID